MAGQQPETAGQSFSQCGDDDIGNVVGSRKRQADAREGCICRQGCQPGWPTLTLVD